MWKKKVPFSSLSPLNKPVKLVALLTHLLQERRDTLYFMGRNDLIKLYIINNRRQKGKKYLSLYQLYCTVYMLRMILLIFHNIFFYSSAIRRNFIFLSEEIFIILFFQQFQSLLYFNTSHCFFKEIFARNRFTEFVFLVR